jgi:signal transduction histidine kinase/ActR/RegA family two-component response regulator
MKTIPLRRRLLILGAAAILPLALMSGVALQALLDQQRRQADQSTLDLARALATAVDTELRLTVSSLQSLALTDPIATANVADLPAAHGFARRVVASRPEWLSVQLAAPDGTALFSTTREFGSPLPPPSEPASIAEVVRTRVPVVGRLRRGPLDRFGIPVRVPVLRDGEVRYVLTAVVRPEAILRVVRQQRIPEDWIVSVFDRGNLRVARSREHDSHLGEPPAPSLMALMAQTRGNEAIGETSTIEGVRVQTAIARLHSTNWTVALGIPAAVREIAMLESFVAYGGGILLSLGLGGIAAWRMSRSIVEPIGRLRDAALALGRGDPVHDARAEVSEVEAVSDALVAAAAQRRQSEVERERLLDAERDARAAAERAQARLRQLVSAGALLSRSLEEQTALAAIGSVIVPDIADICRIDLLDKDGVLQRKLTRHVDPAREAAMHDFVSAHVSPADSPGSFTWAVATGRTFLANLEPSDIERFTDPGFRSFVVDFGLVAACVVPLVARGRTIGAMCALQASSRRRFSEEDGAGIVELAQHAALALDNVRLFGESRDALRDAEIANRAKDEFLAMLGHELRNPLAPIVTSLEVMERRDARVDHEREVIERQVAHLSRMVDDLLDVSRIASGKIELRRERVDVRDVIARALELTQPALQGRRPTVARVPDTPVWVSGDPVRLTQVVCNLLNNAAKFSPPEQPITVELQSSAEEARLAVVDRGTGIAPALLPHVFERFVQGEQPLHRASGGLGLGLAIAKNLVELHGGTIEVESSGEGQGARFAVTLPLAAAGASAASPPAPHRMHPHGRHARVLVVDDNDDAAQSLALILRLEGNEVCVARDGHEALALLDEFVPEAAVLDIGLPKMSGYELAAALRADRRTRSIALIALTGYGRGSDRQRALDSGFDEHLVKPVELDALLTTLNRLLAESAAIAD